MTAPENEGVVPGMLRAFYGDAVADRMLGGPDEETLAALKAEAEAAREEAEACRAEDAAERNARAFARGNDLFRMHAITALIVCACALGIAWLVILTDALVQWVYG